MKKKKGKEAVHEEEEEQERQEEEIEREVDQKVVDGKWGWFVVFCSFICNMIVDGVQYTFANFLMPITTTFDSHVTHVALIGSLLSGFYNFSGPIGGALGNKFGFRMVVVTGSLVSSLGLMISYFAPDIIFLYFFYGVFGGLGFGMVYMASVIMTSVYFEKYRALAASLSVCGTGVGTFVFSPLGTWLVDDFGWRVALVVEGVITLLCILCGWSFKPIRMIVVVPVSKEPSEMSVRRGSIYYDSGKIMPNEAYPTFKEALLQQEERRSTLLSNRTSILGSMGTSDLMPIYSVVTSREMLPEHEELSRGGKCRRLCRVCCFNFWHCRCEQKDLTLGDRPMYRDDIFYGGSLSRLSAYSSSERLNYHLSITRVPVPREVEEHATRKCCVCHHAFIRTCLTMTGLHLLKSKIFAFLCISSFLYTMGLFIPFVFIREYAKKIGIQDNVNVWLVSAIGVSNTVGRLVSGIIKSVVKVNAALFVLICLFISGVFSFVFLLGHHTGFFFFFACVFGFFTAPFISLRPVIIVEFLGLEKLTNAFGLVLLSQGVASIIGPPIAGIVAEESGNLVYVIYLSGSLMMASALMLLASTLLSDMKASGRRGPGEQELQDEEEQYAIAPPNGGWGWVVVACAFYCNVVIDGIQLTFGVFLKSISESFSAEYSSVALAGSLMFGVHLLIGPVCAGFSSEFGLRPVSIAGSLICCFGVGISYFANGCWYLYFSYGILGGAGLGLIYLNTLVITSMYFTTLMPIAIGIVVCGTGVGTMVFAVMGQTLLLATSWQISFLMQAALAGSMSLAVISFRPLKPIRVKVEPNDGRTTPPKDENSTKKHPVYIKRDTASVASPHSSITRFSFAWTSFMEETVITEVERKRCCDCKCCRRCEKLRSEVLVLSEVKSKTSNDRRKSYVEKERISMVDDKILSVTKPSSSTPSVFERVEIDEQPKLVNCDPLRRTLKTMLDYHLLRSCAFFLFTVSGALQMASLLIVFVYEKERCVTDLGFSEEMSVYFVICLGGSNVVWRLFLGALGSIPKVNYRALSIVGTLIGGVATFCSGLNSSVYYQFAFCAVFGLGMASFAVFRLILLRDLVGMEQMVNATGINLLFMGVFCIIFPPIFGWMMEATQSYDVIFYITGGLICASGFMLINLHKLRAKELKRKELVSRVPKPTVN